MDQQKLAEVIVKSVDFRNQFMARINHPDGKSNPKLVKTYYQKIRKEMMQKYADLSQELNTETSKNEVAQRWLPRSFLGKSRPPQNVNNS